MPHVALWQVLEFHKKMGLSIGDPANPDVDVDKDLRYNLIYEEFRELSDALYKPRHEDEDPQLQVIDVADALGDLLYTVCGAAASWGIDLAGVFHEIHQSNMTKSPGNLRADGKILKGPEFKPPDLKRVLAQAKEEIKRQGYGDYSWWPEPTNWDVTEDTIQLELEEPSPEVTRKIMASALEQAKIMAERDFLDEITQERAITIEEAIQEIDSEEISDGIPARIMGEFTRYGAYVFECPTCGRRHAVESKLGTRGGLATQATCECICGNAFLIDFHQGMDATVRVTTIEELRKVSY